MLIKRLHPRNQIYTKQQHDSGKKGSIAKLDAFQLIMPKPRDKENEENRSNCKAI